jgi:hypothetical protein
MTKTREISDILTGVTIDGAVKVNGGTYAGGTDTVTNAGVVIDEEDFIYTQDGGYLRKLIGKTSDSIQVGQNGTSLITSINFLPGTAGNSAVNINGNTIWNAGNDGSGSGLDADLLDGVQGANYLRNNATNANATFTDITLDDQIISSGDANTYMQFHAADQWRVVTGGGERLEVNNSGIGVTGTITASSNITAYSDERLKSNVKTLDGSKVYEMRGVSFTKDGEASSGVIAQELQKVAPELVNDSGEYLSVAYGNLVGYLIEAVKELKAEVEQLKSEK